MTTHTQIQTPVTNIHYFLIKWRETIHQCKLLLFGGKTKDEKIRNISLLLYNYTCIVSRFEDEFDMEFLIKVQTMLNKFASCCSLHVTFFLFKSNQPLKADKTFTIHLCSHHSKFPPFPPFLNDFSLNCAAFSREKERERKKRVQYCD